MEEFKHTLRINEEDLEKALMYWEEAGLITRENDGVQFLFIKEKMYGKKKRAKKKTKLKSKGKQLLDNRPLKVMFDEIQQITGRFLDGTEIREIADWTGDWNASTDVIIGAYVYCKEKGKDNVKYVGAVVKDWTSKGVATKEDIEKFLSEADQKHYIYRRVMQALGFSRNATEEERRIIGTWINDLNCSMDEILFACKKTSGISNPNINYINKVLSNRNGKNEDSKGTSVGVIQKYYDKLRKEAELAGKERRKEVFQKVPQIEKIENQLVDKSRELTTVMITGGPDKLKQIDRIKDKAEELEKEKTILLTENSIPIDYMDVKYECRLCGDTGVLDTGVRCECWLQRSKEAEIWQKKSNAKG